MGSTEARAFCVRAASRNDVAAITAIYREAVLYGTGTFEIEPPDEAEMAARHARIVGGGYSYLVAEQDGQVAGYAYVSAFRDRPAFRFMVEDSVYVGDGMKGRGVGRVLLAELIDASIKSGFRQMVAVIGDRDNAGSVRLHERAGFKPAGGLKAAGWKADRWLDVVLMQRPLGAGDRTEP